MTDTSAVTQGAPCMDSAHVLRVWRNDVVGWLVPKESRALPLLQGSLCHSGHSVAEGSRFTFAKGGWKPLP